MLPCMFGGALARAIAFLARRASTELLPSLSAGQPRAALGADERGHSEDWPLATIRRRDRDMDWNFWIGFAAGFITCATIIAAATRLFVAEWQRPLSSPRDERMRNA